MPRLRIGPPRACVVTRSGPRRIRYERRANRVAGGGRRHAHLRGLWDEVPGEPRVVDLSLVPGAAREQTLCSSRCRRGGVKVRWLDEAWTDDLDAIGKQ